MGQIHILKIDLRINHMRVLNLYAGIGGNRKLWKDCEVTAIEYDEKIAKVYKERFPGDKIYIADAHAFLENWYDKFDFIWSSPPCQSHGQYRHNVGVLGKGYKPIIPDMNLYGEIVFLQTYFKGDWVVENVVPYYTPLISPNFQLQRHLFWSNKYVPEKQFPTTHIRSKNKISDFDDYEIVSKSDIQNKRQVLRNQVDPELGLYVFNSVVGG